MVVLQFEIGPLRNKMKPRASASNSPVPAITSGPTYGAISPHHRRMASLTPPPRYVCSRAHDFLDAPDVASEPSFHRWRDAQRLVSPPEVLGRPYTGRHGPA